MHFSRRGSRRKYGYAGERIQQKKNEPVMNLFYPPAYNRCVNFTASFVNRTRTNINRTNASVAVYYAIFAIVRSRVYENVSRPYDNMTRDFSFLLRRAMFIRLYQRHFAKRVQQSGDVVPLEEDVYEGISGSYRRSCCVTFRDVYIASFHVSLSLSLRI